MSFSSPASSVQTGRLEATNTHSNGNARRTARSPLLDVQDSLSTQAALSSGPSLFSAPSLSSPEGVKFTECGFIETMDQIHDTGNQLLGAFRRTIEQSTHKLKELSLENAKKLKEAAERTQESGVWGMLKKIGSCILAAISIVLGITLTASGAGTLVGAALIASGVISIANFAMTEAGGWDWIAKRIANDNEDLRHKIAFWVPTVVGCIAAVVGVAGSVGSLAWGGLNLAQKAILIVQTAFGLYDGVTTIGKGVSDARLIWTQADLQEIHLKTAIERFLVEDVSTWIKTFIQELYQAQEKAEQIIQLCIQANQKAIHQA
jgi:hypothetical protein